MSFSTMSKNFSIDCDGEFVRIYSEVLCKIGIIICKMSMSTFFGGKDSSTFFMVWYTYLNRVRRSSRSTEKSSQNRSGFRSKYKSTQYSVFILMRELASSWLLRLPTEIKVIISRYYPS